jgi:hypothetical protein
MEEIPPRAQKLNTLPTPCDDGTIPKLNSLGKSAFETISPQNHGRHNPNLIRGHYV